MYFRIIGLIAVVASAQKYVGSELTEILSEMFKATGFEDEEIPEITQKFIGHKGGM